MLGYFADKISLGDAKHIDKPVGQIISALDVIFDVILLNVGLTKIGSCHMTPMYVF